MIDVMHSAGRYGAYVWPAYGVSLVGVVAMTIDTLIRSRRWKREVERRLEGPSPPQNEQA